MAASASGDAGGSKGAREWRTPANGGAAGSAANAGAAPRIADVSNPFPTADQDPRKTAVLSGAAMVMRGLLQVIRQYSYGPESSPAAELELGDRLIEAADALGRYGRAVRGGQLGQLGSPPQ